MRPLKHKLIWKSEEVVEKVLDNVGAAYTEFGLKVEGRAKEKLQKSQSETVNKRKRWVKGGGRGLRTGTLRRSIHLAEPGYNWSQDDVPEGEQGPELGRKPVAAERVFGRVRLLIGSGLHYALPVHQGHDGFEGYHFLTEPLAALKPELPAILAKHKMKG